MFEFWRFKTINSSEYIQLHGEFSYTLIVLSLIIASLAAYSCLIVIGRMWHSNTVKTIQLWKLFGSVVFGLGVWAMHFTGMLAFMIPTSMSYSPGMTVASLIPPMIGAFFSFQILFKQVFSVINIQLSALLLAVGIGTMHFLGMEAMTIDAIMVYDVTWFVLSIIIAHIFACVAIYLIKIQHQYFNDDPKYRFVIASIMGLSVAGMHYTAMGAASFYTEYGASLDHSHSGNSQVIAFVVVLFVTIIFTATLFAAIVDERLQKAESSAEESQNREQDIVNHLADGLIIVDEDGVINSINRTGLRMFDYQSEMIDNRNIETLMPKFDRSSLAKTSSDSGESHSNLTMEGIRNNGSSFPTEVSVSAMSIRSENKRLFNCVVRDITARLELEQQLRQAQKLESMGQLAAGIAHEINTPTQYVSDNTIFLKDAFRTCTDTIINIKSLGSDSKFGSSDEYKNKVNQIIEDNDLDFIVEEVPLALDQSLEGLKRISKIVRAMKSFTHASDHEMHNIDIAEAIESTITIARGEWRYVAELETNFDHSLPKVPCFRDEFNQVVLNFIINAAHAIEEKFKDQESAIGLIKISTYQESEYAIILIEDNGTGIPEEIVERIFDPFFTTKDVGKGTGQGLSLAYSVIVDLHKGKISTDSTPGEGTTFKIALPISKSDLIAKEH